MGSWFQRTHQYLQRNSVCELWTCSQEFGKNSILQFFNLLLLTFSNRNIFFPILSWPLKCCLVIQSKLMFIFTRIHKTTLQNTRWQLKVSYPRGVDYNFKLGIVYSEEFFFSCCSFVKDFFFGNGSICDNFTCKIQDVNQQH